ncbi:MAG: hypothetical protein JKY65_27595 [Planctomycetes bacterium]|nr:hypothetical protein [Planctomycetota bacterium]
MSAPYTTRLQQVLVGPTPRPVLLAVFALASGGAVGLQLQDHEELRRGGVYWLIEDDPAVPTRAPRFDELFADLSSKLMARPQLRAEFLPLFPRALEAAQACRPELTPETLATVSALQAEAAALDPGDLPGAFSLEAQLLISLLIFVSEEERYPRPRYRGGAVALERLFQAVGDPG